MFNNSYNKLRDNLYYQNIKEVVLSEVKDNALNLQYASEELQNDVEVVEQALVRNGMAIQFASKKLKNNPELILKALISNGLALEFISNKMRNDVEIVSLALQNNPRALKFASKELRNNRNLVLKAVQYNGESLQYASKELRDDKEVVLTAVLSSKNALVYASDRLKDDNEVAVTALVKSGLVLREMSERLKDYNEVVSIAVGQEGFALEFASDRLKNDKEVVLKAVRKDGFSIKFASHELQNDDEIIEEALKTSIYAIEIIPKWNNDFFKMSELICQKNNFSISEEAIGPDLKKDREFALLCATKYPASLEWFDSTIRNDKKVMWIAINTQQDFLRYASKELQDNDEIANLALNVEKKRSHHDRSYSVLEHMSDRLQDDEKIVEKAIKSNDDALAFASERLRNNKDFVFKFASEKIDILEYAGDEIKDDKETMLMYSLRNPVTLSSSESCGLMYASDRLRSDKEFITTLFNNDGNAFSPNVLKYAKEEITNNKELMLDLIKKDPNTFKYASEDLRNDVEVVHCTLENRNVQPGIKVYDIEFRIGPTLKKEIGSNNLEDYCKAMILEKQLQNELLNKNEEKKPRIKI